MKVYDWWTHGNSGSYDDDPTKIAGGYHGGSITVMATNEDEARELARAYLSRLEYGHAVGHPSAVDRAPDKVYESPGVVDFDSGDCC